MKKQSEKLALRERYENIAKSEWFKKTHDGMSVSVEDDEPKWTEEDEERLQSCISALQGKSLMGAVDTINTKWLKSLKERMGGTITMTKAELNAHWALPDEYLGDTYTLTHRKEREAFVKGWNKAVELCCEWLYQRQSVDLEVPDIERFVNDCKKYMEGE